MTCVWVNHWDLNAIGRSLDHTGLLTFGILSSDRHQSKLFRRNYSRGRVFVPPILDEGTMLPRSARSKFAYEVPNIESKESDLSDIGRFWVMLNANHGGEMSNLELSLHRPTAKMVHGN